MQLRRLLTQGGKKLVSAFRSRKAISAVISAVILTAATITMSLAILQWTLSRSSNYQEEYSQVMDSEIDRLKERLALEFAFYNSTQKEVRPYLFNWGTVDNVEPQVIRLSNSSWLKAFSNFTLRFLNGTAIPDEALDIGQEGYLALSTAPASLKVGAYYYISVVTKRGTTFTWSFVP